MALWPKDFENPSAEAPGYFQNIFALENNRY